MKQGDWVIVRSNMAGCFWGKLQGYSVPDRMVSLVSSRRLWYWEGAATLDQLATEGTSKPKGCKFPAAITGERVILDVVEILPLEEEARMSLCAVPVWRVDK